MNEATKHAGPEHSARKGRKAKALGFGFLAPEELGKAFRTNESSATVKDVFGSLPRLIAETEMPGCVCSR